METRHNTRSHKQSGLAAVVAKDSDDSNEKGKVDENEKNLELRKTLSDANVYEDNIPTKEMTQILEAINISKADQSFTSQKSDEDEDVVPSSQFPELKNQTPSSLGGRSQRKSASPEYAYSQAVKTTPGTSASDRFDEMMLADKKNVKDPRYMLSPSPDRTLSKPQAVTPFVRLTQIKPEMKPTLMNMNIPMISRYIIDPFECYHPSASNNYPIKPANVSTQRPQFVIEDDEIIIPEELVAERAAMLTQTANQWIQLVYDRSGKKFSWGTPSIPTKVGTPRNNGSLLRDVGMDISIEQAVEADEEKIFDENPRMHPREPGSRQFKNLLPTKRADVYDFDEQDEDDDFDPTNPSGKKKKGKGRGKNPGPKRPASKKTAKKAAPEPDENQMSMSDFIDDSDVQPNTKKRSMSPEYDVVVPQKKKQATGRGKTLGPKSRTPLSVTRTVKPAAVVVPDVEVSQARQRGLSDAEIANNLLTDDESEDEGEEKPRVKKLPSMRLQSGTAYLENRKAHESELAEAQRQECEILAAQEKEKSAELSNQRMSANKNRQLAKELAETEKRKKEEQYRNLSIGSHGPCSSTRQRTELMPDTPQQKKTIMLDEEQTANALRGQTMKVQGKAAAKQVNCPLCNKRFPEKQIEDHASTCGLLVEPPVANINTSRRTPANNVDLHCQVCNNFIADSKIVLTRHKKECVVRMTGEDWS